MGYGATKPLVMAYLVDNPGKAVTVEAIAATTHLDVKQIQHQIQRLVKEGHPVEVITRGRIWRYNPAQDSDGTKETESAIGQLWECIGISKKGNPILKSEDGTLYIAKELDI